MKSLIHSAFRVFSRLLPVLLASAAFGHGTPITVELDASQTALVVTGTSLPGFANTAVINTDEEAYFISGPGGVLLTDLPGFDISGLAAGSAVRLEPVARRPVGSMTNSPRWLWYWDSVLNQVTSVPNDVRLTMESTRALGSISFTEEVGPAPGGVLVANLLAGDLGQHRHLMYYELPDTAATAAGIYGFFARMTSPGKTPSNPFLVVLNKDLDPSTAPALGAAAINLAAGLVGDYNYNGAIDAADFTVWRDSVGQTGAQLHADGDLSSAVTVADLILWQSRYLPQNPTAGVSISEPTATMLLWLSICVFGLVWVGNLNQILKISFGLVQLGSLAGKPDLPV